MSVSYMTGQFWNNISGATASQRSQQNFNADQAEKQRVWEADQAAIQRKWQEDMSNTAIQRQVADAQAAGINPAMMYANSSSSGASTPTGSTARGSAASSGVSSPGAVGVAGLINSAANFARSFNSDKNGSNDVSFREVANTVKLLSTIIK